VTDAPHAAGGWFAAPNRSVARAVGSARAVVGDGDLHMQLEASAGLTRIASTACIVVWQVLVQFNSCCVTCDEAPRAPHPQS
jgi:hypothetical protein